MSSKKEGELQISPEETTQSEDLFSHYPTIAEQLHASADQAQAEAALKDILNLSEAAQIGLLKSLAKTNRSDAADILAALNAFSPSKEVRKEARRGLIRLEAGKTTPQWKSPVTQAPAVQLNTPNPPRFWKGFATQSREEGEVQLILCWEQGYDYGEARLFGFLLDFWSNGIKEVFTHTATKRKIEEQLRTMRTEAADFPLLPCTLTTGKRLIEEALAINAWRKTPPHEGYNLHLPTLNSLIFHVADPGPDDSQTFMTPNMEEQEVAVNFIGAWSFGDYGLAYDLLTPDSPILDNLERTEWIQRHRDWFDEAHPTRMELNFVHEQEVKQSAIWVPNAAPQPANKKTLEVGWALELLETPLSGTLPEMPMGTAVNKETGRRWFWTNFILVKKNNVWRIQNIQDEGAALQGLATNELQKRIKEAEEIIDKKVKQQDKDPQTFVEEMSWRLGQFLHLYDALIAQLPLDYTVNEEAYSRSVLTGNPERTMVYLERLTQRFTENRVDALRRLGSTMAELAFRYDDPNLKGRRDHLLQRSEELLRETVTLDGSAMSHALLAELLMSIERNDEARTEFLKSQELLANEADNPDAAASIEAGLGNIAMRQERFADAIPYLKRVADIKPNYPGVWFSLGFAYRLLGQFDEAEFYYQKERENGTDDVRLYSELTAIYMQRAEIGKAQTLLEDALQLQPQSAYLNALLASVLAEKGDRRRALKYLEEAERIDPNSDFIPAVRQQISGTAKRL